MAFQGLTIGMKPLSPEDLQVGATAYGAPTAAWKAALEAQMKRNQLAYQPAQIEQALLKQALANQLSQAVLPYAPRKELAGIGLKEAQAALAQAQGGKAAVERDAMVRSLDDYYGGGGAQPSLPIGGGRGGPPFSPGMGRPGSGGGEESRGGFSQVPRPNEPLSITDQPTIGGKAAPSLHYDPQENELTMDIPEDYHSPFASGNLPGMPSPGQMLGQKLLTGQSLLPAQELQVEKAKTRQQLETKNLLEGINDASNAAVEANKGLQHLNRFHQTYQESNMAQKGPVGHRLFGALSRNQIMNQSSGAMVNAASRLLQSGHITQGDRDAVQAAKIYGALSPRAEQEIYTILHDGLMREREEVAFYQAGAALDVPFSTLKTMWAQYNKDYPALEHGQKAYPKNLWNVYLAPDALQAFKKGRSYTPPSIKELKILAGGADGE